MNKLPILGARRPDIARKALASLCIGTALWATPVSAGPISAVYGFGDSLTDTGNANIAAQGLFPLPAEYFSGRFSNGPLYIDHIAEAFGTRAQPALAGGTNYAFGGAEIDGTSPPDLSLQVQTFQASRLFAPADPDALYVVWGGGNDLRSAYTQDIDVATFAADRAAGLSAVIGSLSDAGAQRILVPNQADIGLTPEGRATDPVTSQRGSALTAAFNAALDQALQQLQAVRPIDLIRLDVASLFSTALADPGRFGLTNVTDACFSGTPSDLGTVCANPENYLFWDYVHPSATGHRLIGDAAIAAIQASLGSGSESNGNSPPLAVVSEPGSLGLLGAGMIVLAAVLRRRREA